MQSYRMCVISGCLLLLAAGAGHAQTVFGFGHNPVDIGRQTPITNIAPDPGSRDPNERLSFSVVGNQIGATQPDAFTFGDNNPSSNGGKPFFAENMSGTVLLNAFSSTGADILQANFSSTALNSVGFDFALGNPGVVHLDALQGASVVGFANVSSSTTADPEGDYEGHFNYFPIGTQFTTINLYTLTAVGGAPLLTSFVLDNFNAGEVPEPGALAIVAGALPTFVAVRRRYAARA